jgi:ATP-dependent protease Clp ATPase subunit
MSVRDWFKKRPSIQADVRCTFCGKGPDEAEKIIGGPAPYFVCDGCVRAQADVLEQEERRLAKLPSNCSFCGKRRRDVPHLLGTKESSICSECLGLCQDILKEERGTRA